MVANIANAKLALIAKKFALDLFSLADFMMFPSCFECCTRQFVPESD